MINRRLITFLAVALTIVFSDSVWGQVATQPFAIRDSDTRTVDIDQFVIKGDKKTHTFEMDTASVDYKSLSRIDPNWIKHVEIVKGDQLHGGGTRTAVIITLKKGRVKRLPDDMRVKFE